jgi:hypothetical protein
METLEPAFMQHNCYQQIVYLGLKLIQHDWYWHIFQQSAENICQPPEWLQEMFHISCLVKHCTRMLGVAQWFSS